MVTPDYYVINKQSLAIEESRIAVKSVEILTAPNGGTYQHRVTTERQLTAVLTSDELSKLAELGKELELSFGSPQDFEWVIDATLPFPANVFLVQSRPVKMAKTLKTPVEEIVDLMVERTLRS
jgi:pyruvate,water dikinase